jgi:hypothetical protein
MGFMRLESPYQLESIHQPLWGIAEQVGAVNVPVRRSPEGNVASNVPITVVELIVLSVTEPLAAN